MGNVQNRIVSPSGENLARLPTNFEVPALVAWLERWAALYPGTRPSKAGDPPLPYFATLHQALNVAACDARVLVIVLSSTQATRRRLEALVTPLAWTPEFSGRCHFVRCLPTDGTLPRVRGLARRDNVYLVIPDEFGMTGRVSGTLGIHSSPVDVLEAARKALAVHYRRFKPRTLVEKFQLHTDLGERPWFYLPECNADKEDPSWQRKAAVRSVHRRFAGSGRSRRRSSS
jgi:hypothetical protein